MFPLLAPVAMTVAFLGAVRRYRKSNPGIEDRGVAAARHYMLVHRIR